jgi:hypothetical protein
MTMREATYALRGPVRTFRTETAAFVLRDGHYVEEPRVLQMTADFNTDGNRTDLKIYDDKGVLSRQIEMKFEGRKLIEFLNYDGKGHMWLRGTTFYDDEGRVTGNATYHGDGSLRSKRVLTRDKEGRVIESSEYNAKGTLLDKISNTFDAGDLKTSHRSLYGADGSLQSTEARDIAEKSVDTVTYNRDGSVASKSIRVDKEISEYARDGSLRKTTTISSQGRLLDEVMLDEGRSRRETQIPDLIDSHGNWIKQTKWVTDSTGTRPVKVTYRTLTYYYEKFAF